MNYNPANTRVPDKVIKLEGSGPNCGGLDRPAVRGDMGTGCGVGIPAGKQSGSHVEGELSQSTKKGKGSLFYPGCSTSIIWLRR